MQSRLEAHVSAAVESLRSVRKLVDAMPHMPVSRLIGRRAARAVSALSRLTACLATDAVGSTNEPPRQEPQQWVRPQCSLREGLLAAMEARAAAEACYADPSMTPRLYFPVRRCFASLCMPGASRTLLTSSSTNLHQDDFLYAVYGPLLAPLVLPIFLALIAEARAMIRKRAKLAAAASRTLAPAHPPAANEASGPPPAPPTDL